MWYNMSTAKNGDAGAANTRHHLTSHSRRSTVVATVDSIPSSDQNQETEEWRDILGYEGRYQVSDLGRIRALFAGANNRYKPNRVLKPGRDARGYMRVSLPHGSGYASRKVHSLVMIAFLGPAPFVKAEINHIDGNPSNNRLNNLEWCTRQENEYHKRVVLGRGNEGVRNGQAKLSEDDAREIARLSQLGMSDDEIATQFDISRSAVGMILTRQTWRHLDIPRRNGDDRAVKACLGCGKPIVRATETGHEFRRRHFCTFKCYDAARKRAERRGKKLAYMDAKEGVT